MAVFPREKKAQIQGYNGSTFQDLRADRSTNAINTIEYEHHELHAGSMFCVNNMADLGSGASAVFLISTPSTSTWAHLKYDVSVEAEMSLQMWESSTTSSDGVALSVYNRNRNSSGSNTVAIYISPNITASGTQIGALKRGGGTSAPGRFGGNARADDEFILKTGTKYLMKIINDGAGTAWYSAKMCWYEHADIN